MTTLNERAADVLARARWRLAAEPWRGLSAAIGYGAAENVAFNAVYDADEAQGWPRSTWSLLHACVIAERRLRGTP
jgi:hypothetical protein